MTHFVIGEEGKEEELNDFIEDEPQEERNDEKDTFSEDDDDEISDEELQGKKKGRSLISSCFSDDFDIRI